MTPPTHFLVSLLAVVGVHVAVPFGRVSILALQWVGVVLILIGVGSNVVASRLFERRGIAIRPGSRSGVLATGGLFRLSRNPMYLGMALILAGAALALGSLSGLVVTGVFVAVADRAFIRYEEALLDAEFGQEYADYQARVRRWI